jgi:pimeloyl-ACP methyl ester carboxylesterase
MAAMTPEPFKITVPAPVLEDLHERLRRTRWPDDPDNEQWRFGASRAYLEPLVRHWLDTYDWPAVEADLNSVPNFVVNLEGQRVHFVHVRGNGPDPFPLVLTHGYPWTYWDYRRVIGPLTDPVAFGGDPADAFDVVVPSIPGYVFSTPMRSGGVSARVTAGLWVRLMRDVLRYGPFGSAGGDWGAVISIMLGHLYPEDVAGIYVTLANFAPALRNRFEGFELDDLGPEERIWYERFWQRKPRQGKSASRFEGPGAAVLRAPMSEAYAGHDSPLALAVSIVESRRLNGDTHGDVERRFSKDDLLTNTMLYWVTGSWASARRFYWHTARDPVSVAEGRQPLVPVATGVGAYPADVFYVPRKHIERDANLVQLDLHEAGGHFAAAEEPEAFVGDVRRFFRPLRRGSGLGR